MFNRKETMNDIVVLIPGIMGSTLLDEESGNDLWGTYKSITWAVGKQFNPNLANNILQKLSLKRNYNPETCSPENYDKGDCIRPGTLLTTPRLIANLFRTDGYSAISNMINQKFRVTRGNNEGNCAANYFEFSYDWRLDNRIAAYKLQTLINERLPLWQDHLREEHPNNKTDPKVILIGHSMGGLIARYYLEVLKGWKKCRMLVSLGTPYSGSVDALNFLANGTNIEREVIQSFDSIYQLLPTYQMFNVADNYKKISEINNIPNIDREKVKKAEAFHQEIKNAVDENMGASEYPDWRFNMNFVCGVQQKSTLQSAQLSEGKLTVSSELPPSFRPGFADGDGTVPHLSAIPSEFLDKSVGFFLPVRHGYLQTSKKSLEHLFSKLKKSQNIVEPEKVREAFLGETKEMDTQQPAISLDINYQYSVNDIVRVRVALLGINEEDIGSLEAKITPVNQGGGISENTPQFQKDDDCWNLNISGLQNPGLYKLEVKTFNEGPSAPPSVYELFEITNSYFSQTN